MSAETVRKHLAGTGVARSLLAAWAAVAVVAGVAVAQEAPFPPAQEQPAPPGVTGLAEEVRPVVITEFVTLDYVETPAEDVVNAVARSTGRNIIWAAKANKQARVTVHVRNGEWRDALRMVLDQIGGVIIEETPARVQIDTPKPITAEWVEDDLKLVIETIARIGDASIIVGPNVEGTVTARVVNQPWTKALEDIVKTAGFVTVREADVIRVVHPATLQQQLATKVFKLKYVLPPDTYRPKIDSEYLAGGPTATGSDARRAYAAAGAGMAAYGQLGAPTGPGARGGAAAAAPKIEEITFPLFYAVQRVLTKGVGQVTYDPDRNMLVVTDTEPVLKDVEAMLARLDTEPEQVFVDVKFIAIQGPRTVVGEGGTSQRNVTDLLEFGVDWTRGITGTHTGATGIPSTFPWAGENRPRLDAGTPGTLTFGQLETILQLLKDDGNAQVIQAPKLTILDHNEATIFVGDTIRFAESAASTNQAGGLTFSYKEATNSPIATGFQLLIIPHIVAGSDKVILNLIPQRTTFRSFDVFGAADQGQILLPQVSSDTVVTKMLLRDKETAVIGGLIDESETEPVRKVPFLGDIPVAGWLFKRQSIMKTRRNLVIFVTVHLVRQTDQLRDFYASYEDYDGVAPEFATDFDLKRLRKTEQAAVAARRGVKVEATKPAEPATKETETPGWKQTPEGIEYTVPTKGAEKEKPAGEVELSR
jgi:type II secretory pathway component GspD/PulD (secretin)